MNLLQPSPRSGGAARLADLARLARRICVLREQGEPVAASRLEENEWATMVRDFRLADGPESLPEGELRALFATEERRVADAAVLAELIIPRIIGALPAISTGAQLTGKNVPQERGSSVSSFRPTENTAGSPAIPDLLDAMLAADSAARRKSANRRLD